MAEEKVAPPKAVVFDLGKHKSKKIKKLRKGEGPLIDEVMLAIDDLKANGLVDANAQPVVVVVREKSSPRNPWRFQ
jgi:hypothetical protein